jgi:amino acid transporter
MILNKLKRLVIGQPIASEHHHQELLPKWKALALLASDALSSVAYATEEVLLVLVMVGPMALGYSVPVAIAISILLLIVAISYRQTIDAYPSGGGSYIVAKENLGAGAGLVAGAALLIDYALTVSVSVCSGVENIAAAFPWLQQHIILAELIVIGLLMLLSLRGLNESASLVAGPCYFFIFSVIILIVKGLFSDGHIPVEQVLHDQTGAVGTLVLLRAFSSGCSALTGVEAISNGIPIFKDPKQRNAKTTLTVMVLILGAFFLGITVLVRAYGLTPQPGQTLIAQLGRAVWGGDSLGFYALQFGVASILFLAASTSYADFPRLASLLAHDRYAPRQFASLGDRLVFSNGIIGLSLFAAIMVVAFGGHAHNLIPLYAVGVFMSFTLSQSGMVVHHWKLREPHWQGGLVINLIGAITTGVVLCVVAFTKFTHGAWMVLIFIPTFVFAFSRIHRHYLALGDELARVGNVAERLAKQMRTEVIIPVSGIHAGVVDAYRYALALSSSPRFLFVEIEPGSAQKTQKDLSEMLPHGQIVVVASPYRSVVGPILDYVDQRLADPSVEFVTLVIPEFITRKWYHQFLHNQTALILKAALIFKRRVVVASVRYHLMST